MSEIEKIVYICYNRKKLITMTDLCRRLYPSYMFCSYRTAYKLYYDSPKDINNYNNDNIDYWIDFLIKKCDSLWLLDFDCYDKELAYADKHKIKIERM